MKCTVTVAAALAAAASLAVAAEGPSLEKGKELFGSSKLGTNGKSCATCHPGGKGLEGAARLSDSKLSEIINACIEKPLNGKALNPASQEMKSLMAYIRTLPDTGKK
ncbi:c-type cytochrome [Geobacter sp. DSM 9736]|uniref:c-type cytochrome n=1 Tax=Geobacter sp. DSM 9736 TaxID=1277350 RepID=UPI000B604218|nr:cytochrome C [Geobacter sp. DSM 9736]SNB45244.1 hypothetical protein SAMN06269301_0647 [Geobacter sp. DSM 9736]